MHVRDVLNRDTLLKSLAIGAGLIILAVGIAIAQPAPAGRPVPGVAVEPLPPAPAAIVEQCRQEVEPILVPHEMRERMRRCIEAKREAAGLNQRSDRRQAREAAQVRRQVQRRACREEVKDQRLTEAERRDAVNACIGRSDPQFAKMQSCRKEAAERKLEPRTAPFREFMRGCVRAA